MDNHHGVWEITLNFFLTNSSYTDQFKFFLVQCTGKKICQKNSPVCVPFLGKGHVEALRTSERMTRNHTSPGIRQSPINMFWENTKSFPNKHRAWTLRKGQNSSQQDRWSGKPRNRPSPQLWQIKVSCFQSVLNQVFLLDLVNYWNVNPLNHLRWLMANNTA